MNTAAIFFLAIVCASLVGFLASRAEQLCRTLGLLDVPDERKLHRKVTPLVGGLALTTIILPLSIVSYVWAGDPLHVESGIVIVIATFAMSLIGIADDRHSLKARDRILLSLIVFGSVAIVDSTFNIRVLSFVVPDVEFGLAAWPFAIVFTTICCIGLVNAVNMADGKNGLVIGLCVGWLTILVALSDWSFLPFISLLCAGLLTLLIFNIRGRLFLGDGGSYGFATAVGLLTIQLYNSPGNYHGRAISADQIMLLFSVPVLDSFRLTFARIWRGQSPVVGDRDHLHHHLHAKLGWPTGLLAYWFVALIPAIMFIGA